ncbi:MAG: glycosyltransferase family 2 protein [Leptolyngbyaceae cyanobacterium CSU_1_3]|nr:glycosyltransferase family 2 protein [Leptolyngbyaceae cyanobacterium CSU_1_3]
MVSQLWGFWVGAMLLIGASGVLILSVVLFAECLAALFSKIPLPSLLQDWSHTRVTVLVPAHNEEICIYPTLVQLGANLKPQDQLVVVADNCTDATVDIARSLGATVIERHDLTQIGKGYALDFGLHYVADDPPDVVVFVDADSQVQANTIQKLTQCAIVTGRPIQATYLMSKPLCSTPKDSVSAFAFKVKNLVRPSGLAQLGLPCLLTGTGMAFPWSVIRSVNLASGDLVEDMKLSLDLAVTGHPPLLCQDAIVIGQLPQHKQAAESQRTRWEHGHLQTILTHVPRMIGVALQKQQWKPLVLALDLCIPPLSLFVVIWAGLTIASLFASILGASWGAMTVLTIAGLFLLSAMLLAWAKFGRADLLLAELLTIPFYILWKIPLYLKFLVKPQSKWVKTERDAISLPKPPSVREVASIDD